MIFKQLIQIFFFVFFILNSNILKGNGFGIEEALQSIEIVSSIRNMKVSEKTFNYHSFL